MPRLVASLLALALALVSCGEDEAQLLPGGTAREITANLDAVQRLADEGDCLGAESAAAQVSEQVEALEGVDERLKRALREGATRLNEVVTECDEETEAPEPVPVPTEEEPDLDGEKEEKEEEREEEEKAKEQEEEEEEGEEEGDGEEGSPSLPPPAEGEGNGLDNGNGSGPNSQEEGGGTPSGGLGQGSPAGEG